MKLNVGIIGFGRIGNGHAAWIQQTSCVSVGAVYDATPARRALDNLHRKLIRLAKEAKIDMLVVGGHGH